MQAQVSHSPSQMCRVHVHDVLPRRLRSHPTPPDRRKSILIRSSSSHDMRNIPAPRLHGVTLEMRHLSGWKRPVSGSRLYLCLIILFPLSRTSQRWRSWDHQIPGNYLVENRRSSDIFEDLRTLLVILMMHLATPRIHNGSTVLH